MTALQHLLPFRSRVSVKRHRVHVVHPQPGADLQRLRPLLDAAATLDLDDREGWAHLRDAARVTVGALIAGGRLPAYLAVAADDSPMVVSRTLTAAWQRLGDRTDRGHEPI